MAATVTQSTSKDGRFTIVVESSFEYESEIADVPTGEQTTYLIDNTTGSKSTVYHYSGIGYGSPGEIYFSGDSKFAVFPGPGQSLYNFNDFLVVNIETKEISSLGANGYEERTFTLSADGSRLIWSGYNWQYYPARDVYYFPSIAQFSLPKMSGIKIDYYHKGAAAVGDTINITLDLKGITQASGERGITLSLNTGGVAVYDAAASRPGQSYVFTYVVRPDDVAKVLAITSINLNGATLKGADGKPALISNDLGSLGDAKLAPVSILVDGYKGSDKGEDFRGTEGAETFQGGGGDDSYLVDNPNDKVIEKVGGGTDTVVTTISYALAARQEIESLRIAATQKTANIDLTGNEFAQRLEGNAGNNTLDGRAGADVMDGRAGNDTYVVDNIGDVVLEAEGAGFDRVLASVSYTLASRQEIEELSAATKTSTAPLRLVGNGFAQTIAGNAGDNEIVGKGGGDVLIGRGGNDTYFVRDQSDRVIEAKGGGFDTIRTGKSYALAAGQEVELLGFTEEAGTADLALTGNEFAQTLRGNDGDNRLDGRGGADTLIGRGGNDTYIVDNPGDGVIEGRGGGNDTVLASTSFTLGAGQAVEVLRLLPSDAKGPLKLIGNAFAQTLYGNADANVLDGQGGADVMAGFGGNDTYRVDDARDSVSEARGQGTDTVISTVSYVLAAGQEIEALRIGSGVGERSLDLTGNAFGQVLEGSAGDNVLDGLGGADVLTGGRGQDSFVFSTKPGSGNVDRITDFAPVDDTIRLAQDVFTALDAGPLAARAFKDIGKAGRDADDRILYDSRNGKLFYDADGSGKGAAVQIAVLDNHAKLTHDDFFVV